MKQLVVRFVRNDEGQDLIEYVLIGTLVSIAVVLGAGALGTNLNNWYNSLAGWVSRRSAAVPAN
jgi:pilus assembly protein Flp/PilA